MKFLLSFLFASLLTGSVSQWSTDFAKAKTEAKDSKKYILLVFSGSDWCMPCIRTRKEIFDSEVFNSYAKDHLILVLADFPRQKSNALDPAVAKSNAELAARYNPSGDFPLTLLMDANEKIWMTWEGQPATNATQFVDQLKSLCHDSK